VRAVLDHQQTPQVLMATHLLMEWSLLVVEQVEELQLAVALLLVLSLLLLAQLQVFPILALLRSAQLPELATQAV
jgi:hypothetical protein